MDKCNSKTVTDKPEIEALFYVMGQDDCPICGSLLDVLYHPIYLWGVSCNVCQFGNAISVPDFDTTKIDWCKLEVQND